MLKRHTNFNTVGKISCLGLLALTFFLVRPIAATPDKAHAIDAGQDSKLSVGETPSTVNLSFAPASGSGSITPNASTGAKAQTNVIANIDVSNSSGYSVYLGSNSSNLVGKDNKHTVPGISGTSTFQNLPVNTWGYYAGEGTSIPETAQYQAVAAGQGNVIYQNPSHKIYSESKTLILSFVTNIAGDIPADTYQNAITLSVVSSPLKTTLTDISTMQEMTSKICQDSVLNETKQLKDTRDGKLYWVAKLPDEKCWMTQNLNLDLGTSWPSPAGSDYDVAATAYPPVATASSVTASTISSPSISTRSWSLGDYVITNPETPSDCGHQNNSFADCPTEFTSVVGKTASSDPDFYIKNGKQTVVGNQYDAHYLVGNHYQYNTATAGTGGVIAGANASGSICPKNWQLPTSNNTNPSSFANLINAGDIGYDVAKLTGNGYFFVRGGVIYQDPE